MLLLLLMMINNDGVGRCHWLMEPFVVSAMRQLSSVHPVYKLLKPYFR